MSSPGTRFPKNGADTKRAQSSGSKQLKTESLRMGQATTIGKASTMRVYTRDYCKVRPDAEASDTVSPYLGNPLGF